MQPSLSPADLIMALRAALMGVPCEMDADEIRFGTIGGLQLKLAGLSGYRDSLGRLVLVASPSVAQADPTYVPVLMLNTALGAALALSQAKGEARSMPECAEEVRRAVGVLIRDNSLPATVAPKASH